jgi:hypothetical protein
MYNWDDAIADTAKVKLNAESWIAAAAKYRLDYQKYLSNEEMLADILSKVNACTFKLGEYQAQIKRVFAWTEKRWEMEKGLNTVALYRDKKATSISAAKEMKYEGIEHLLDPVAEADALHLRIQNARSSNRDTAEAIRSRISQIKQSR